MNEQHTPGPWEVHGGSDYPNPRVNGSNGRAVANAVQRDDWHKGDGIPMATAHANARLIAAAPDLLAVLRDCLPFIDDANDIAQFFPESAATNACRGAVKRARAAIARALPQGAPHD